MLSRRSTFILNEDGSFDWVNPAFQQAWGFSLAELKGRNPKMFWQPGDENSTIWQDFQEGIKAQEAFTLQGYLLSKAGEPYCVRIDFFPSQMPGKQWIGEVTDITEQQQRILALREKTNVLNAFINSTTDTNFLLGPGPEYAVLAYNKAAAEATRALFQRELQVGDSFLDYTVPDLQPKFKEDVAKALAGDKVEEERKVAYEPGLEVYWQATYEPAYDEDGTVMGVAFNITNIDAQRKYQLALEEKNQRLEEISHLQSHEIRRPVASLLGLLNLLNPNKFDEENKAIVELMQGSIHEMDEVVHKVMELTYDYEQITVFKPSETPAGAE